jgi:hypothetical protein
MKPHALAVIAAFLLSGCNVVAWGNVFLVLITFALLYATLSLGRRVPSDDRPESAE